MISCLLNGNVAAPDSVRAAGRTKTKNPKLCSQPRLLAAVFDMDMKQAAPGHAEKSTIVISASSAS
jgi:hypothetical protein